MDPALTWADLGELASECSVPVLVKGLLTAEDAALAVEHGAAGVVVSNHGGRQLDRALATADALPEVVDAVAGRATRARRRRHPPRRRRRRSRWRSAPTRCWSAGPPLWGLAAGGAEGAARVLELLREPSSSWPSRSRLRLARRARPAPTCARRQPRPTRPYIRSE